MPIKQISVERFCVISTKPLEDVVAAIDAAVGHPNLGQMHGDVAATNTYGEMGAVIHKLLGPAGLMEFMRLDMGSYLAKGRVGATPKSVRLLIGNPLIMRRMAEHAPDAASYAPVTILIDERGDGVHISYDRMASFLACYENTAASEVAIDLDRKVEALLMAAAA